MSPPTPYPTGCSPSPPISRANGSAGQDLAIGLMIGEIRAAAHHTHARLDRIDHRLESGDRRMSEMTDRIASLERRPTSDVPTVEWLVKDALRYIVPLGVLYVTGSLEAALMWLKMLAAK